MRTPGFLRLAMLNWAREIGRPFSPKEIKAAFPHIQPLFVHFNIYECVRAGILKETYIAFQTRVLEYVHESPGIYNPSTLIPK